MPPSALLAHQGDVQAIDAEREANGRQRAAEAAEQLVVAATAADRRPQRLVVHLEYGARVVADAAHQAKVEDHARGDVRLEQLVHFAHVRHGVGDNTLGAVQQLRATAALGHA